MAGTYTHLASTGDRRSVIITSRNVGGGNDNGISLIDGNAASTNFWLTGAVAGLYIRFDFQSSLIVTEARWKQDSAASHGVWKWQGSADASAWTDIGATFTLGGATTQTQTTLSGNTTAYRYYQLIGVSGSGNSGPWIHEVEFQAEDGSDTYSYYHPQGAGPRTLTITTTWTGLSFGTGTPVNLVNGLTSNDFWWTGTPTAGAFLKWDFGSARIVNEVQWLQESAVTHGVWQVQGSPDDSAWTNLGSTFTLGGATRQTISAGGNTTAYRYYRFAWQSGGLNNGPWLYEVLFKTEAAAAAVTLLALTQAVLETADHPLPDIRQTQAALEVAHAVAALAMLETQAALEHVRFPPNAIWATQVCLEVLFPAADFVEPVTALHNYAYTGLLART